MYENDQLLPCLRQLLYQKKMLISSRLAASEGERIKLAQRQRQMIQDLREFLPIVEFDGKYSICMIFLPQSLKAHDDTQVSIAIGYVTLMLTQLSDILGLTLRFPLRFEGSRSQIYCTRRCKTFPLHLDSSRENFDNGVALLNLNIMQMRILYGLATEDPNYILKNLYDFLDHLQVVDI